MKMVGNDTVKAMQENMIILSRYHPKIAHILSLHHHDNSNSAWYLQK